MVRKRRDLHDIPMQLFLDVSKNTTCQQQDLTMIHEDDAASVFF